MNDFYCTIFADAKLVYECDATVVPTNIIIPRAGFHKTPIKCKARCYRKEFDLFCGKQG